MSDPSADFNKVLEQVLKFTETVVDEYSAAEPKTLNLVRVPGQTPGLESSDRLFLSHRCEEICGDCQLGITLPQHVL
jgi:hypothetical protein